MKKSYQTVNSQKREQIYTKEDSLHFDRLMESTHRQPGLIENTANPEKSWNKFEYSDSDSKLFESLATPLSRYQRRLSTSAKLVRGSSYTDDDQALFDSLIPESESTDGPDPSPVKNVDQSFRDQRYSKADLIKFRTLFPVMDEGELGEAEQGFLPKSSRDRDVGKVKIKQFDQPREGKTTQSGLGQSGIKIKYFY